MKLKTIFQAAAFTVFLFSIASPVFAVRPSFFLEPDSGYLSNDVIDIIAHDGGVWLATDEGLNFSSDNGQSWFYYDENNGLVSSGISAIFSIPTATGNRIWTASNHEEEISGVLFSLSDGVSYSDDNGNTWTQIQFDTPPNDIDYVWGGDRTIFDITGHYDETNPEFDDWMFFTSFAGGFLASRDGGMSWRRIFPLKTDSVQFYNLDEVPSLRNRYFSCVADTSHSDSLFVWAGTAAGMFQFIYAEPKDKAYSKLTNDIYFCENCATDDSLYIYYAGDNGFMRSARNGGAASTKFQNNGLPGDKITAMLNYAGMIFVGTADNSASTGLAYSADLGESFTAVSGFTEVIGGNRKISELTVLNDRIYLAAEEAGLFVSADTGLTWQHILVDSLNLDPLNRREVIHSLNAWGDTLRIGTDSGLVNLYMDASGNFDPNLSLFYIFDEDSFSSGKVYKVYSQLFEGSTDVIWTINHPLDELVGSPAVGRSIDGGQTFTMMQSNVTMYDMTFFGDTAYMSGANGVRYSPTGLNPGVPEFLSIREYANGFVIDSMTFDPGSAVPDTITVFNRYNDTILVGSNNGYAISNDAGDTYNIYRINNDSLAADAVLHYSSEILGIDGNWVPAMNVQYDNDSPFARLWASTRPTYGGLNSITVGFAIDTAGTNRLFRNVYDNFAWNFAFNGDTVFAATNNGLIYTVVSDSLLLNAVDIVWDTLQLKDSDGYDLLLPETAVYGVEVVGNYLWIGSDDRTVLVDLNNIDSQTPFFVIDNNTPTDQVYAFPVPYSHVQSQVVEFHFTLEQEADVTLEIYDFAMNLVKRVIDSEPFNAGVYPTAGFGRRTWDGTNGKGDEVAVGVYYFKLELSTGDTRWGKIAVIP